MVRAAPDRWRALVQSARPAVDYFFDLVRRELDLSTAQGKSEAVDLGPAPLISRGRQRGPTRRITRNWRA